MRKEIRLMRKESEGKDAAKLKILKEMKELNRPLSWTYQAGERDI
jgi:hypothetical protein